MTDEILKIAISAHFAAFEVSDSLAIHLDDIGLRSEITVAPPTDIVQHLLDPSGSIQNADCAVLLIQAEQFCSSANGGTISTPSKLDLFLRAVQTAVSLQSGLKVLIVSCPPSPSREETEATTLVEQRLTSELAKFSEAVYFSSELWSRYFPEIAPKSCSVECSASPSGYLYNSLCFATIGTIIARHIYNHFTPARKVIVLDCDGTLWTGNCGELAITQLKIDANHQALQELLVERARNGQLLCLCSSNNEEDVLSVLDRHPEMILRREHLALIRVNWLPKSQNLESLAEELNLSLDSFVFIDDESFQCQSIAKIHPEVRVLQIPTDSSQIPLFILQSWDLDRREATAEDTARLSYYRSDNERQILRENSLTLSDYIESLDLKVHFPHLISKDVARAGQLMQRVTQFTLNERRWSPRELYSWTDRFKAHIITASDRFGDYGIIGVMMFRISGGVLELTGLVLSCRALGRGVEAKLARFIVDRAGAEGASQIHFQFRSTLRNQPIKNFLTQLGVGEDMSIAVTAIRSLTTALVSTS